MWSAALPRRFGLSPGDTHGLWRADPKRRGGGALQSLFLGVGGKSASLSP
jgi:hypothetical protein